MFIVLVCRKEREKNRYLLPSKYLRFINIESDGFNTVGTGAKHSTRVRYNSRCMYSVPNI
jgi:hypothetical protein